MAMAMAVNSYSKCILRHRPQKRLRHRPMGRTLHLPSILWTTAPFNTTGDRYFSFQIEQPSHMDDCPKPMPAEALALAILATKWSDRPSIQMGRPHGAPDPPDVYAREAFSNIKLSSLSVEVCFRYGPVSYLPSSS